MILPEIRRQAIGPALLLLPAKMSSPEAEVMLLAIGLQESRLIHQRQIKGPARGLWQFEQGGGTAGVLRHPQTARLARVVCAARGVEPTPAAVQSALAGTDDVLDAALARLLLWSDPGRLPVEGDVDGAWQLYLRTWRPGAHTRGSEAQKWALRDKWARNYAAALREVYP
jgi:hypothetical protein